MKCLEFGEHAGVGWVRIFSSQARTHSGLPLHLFSPSSSLFARGFLSFDSLPLLVHLSTLQYPLHDFACIDILEIMIANLLVNFQFLGSGIRIVGEWYEGCRAMVNSIGNSKGKVNKVCCCGSKRGRKNNGIDVLGC